MIHVCSANVLKMLSPFLCITPIEIASIDIFWVTKKLKELNEQQNMVNGEKLP